MTWLWLNNKYFFQGTFLLRSCSIHVGSKCCCWSSENVTLSCARQSLISFVLIRSTALSPLRQGEKHTRSHIHTHTCKNREKESYREATPQPLRSSPSSSLSLSINLSSAATIHSSFLFICSLLSASPPSIHNLQSLLQFSFISYSPG